MNNEKTYKVGDKIKFWFYWYRYGYQKAKKTNVGTIIRIISKNFVEVQLDSGRKRNLPIDHIIERTK